MNIDETKNKLSKFLQNTVRINFSDLMPDRNYVLVMPFALKQMLLYESDPKLQLTGKNKPKWYIPVTCYFLEDTEVSRSDTKLPFWVKKNEIVRIKFSGYGLFDQLEHCPDKDIKQISDMNDGFKIILRRDTNSRNKKKVNNFWNMLQITLVKHEEYPQNVKDSGVR